VSSALGNGAYAVALPEATGNNLLLLSEASSLPVLRGIKINPKNPFNFDFIIDSRGVSEPAKLKEQAQAAIAFFLTGLAIPQKDLWVNLSPYEKGRIVADSLATTELGSELLSQDYILKQLAASLTYPETEAGKRYWDEINNAVPAGRQVGARLPRPGRGNPAPTINFQRVWIVPDNVKICEDNDKAFVASCRLKVLTDEDYAAMDNKDAFRTHILPLIEKEVNQGKSFARLRQTYKALILAAWFKKHLKENIINKIYSGQNKVNGVNTADPKTKEKIYAQYLQSCKQGAYNYIKREQSFNKILRRQYFSGGLEMAVDPVVKPLTLPLPRFDGAVTTELTVAGTPKMPPQVIEQIIHGLFVVEENGRRVIYANNGDLLKYRAQFEKFLGDNVSEKMMLRYIVAHEVFHAIVEKASQDPKIGRALRFYTDQDEEDSADNFAFACTLGKDKLYKFERDDLADIGEKIGIDLLYMAERNSKSVDDLLDAFNIDADVEFKTPDELEVVKREAEKRGDAVKPMTAEVSEMVRTIAGVATTTAIIGTAVWAVIDAANMLANVNDFKMHAKEFCSSHTPRQIRAVVNKYVDYVKADSSGFYPMNIGRILDDAGEWMESFTEKQLIRLLRAMVLTAPYEVLKNVDKFEPRLTTGQIKALFAKAKWDGEDYYDKHSGFERVVKALSYLDRAQAVNIILTDGPVLYEYTLKHIPELNAYLSPSQLALLLRSIVVKESYCSKYVLDSRGQWLPLLPGNYILDVLNLIVDVDKDFGLYISQLLSCIHEFAPYLGRPGTRSLLSRILAKDPDLILTKTESFTPYYSEPEFLSLLTAVIGNCSSAVLSAHRGKWEKHFKGNPQELIDKAKVREDAQAAAYRLSRPSYTSSDSGADSGGNTNDETPFDDSGPTPDRSGFTKTIADILQGLFAVEQDGKLKIYTNRQQLEQHLGDIAKELGIPREQLTLEMARRYIDGHETGHALCHVLGIKLDRNTEERFSDLIAMAFLKNGVNIPKGLRPIITIVTAALNTKLRAEGKITEDIDFFEYIQNLDPYDHADPKALEALLRTIGIDVEVIDSTPEEMARIKAQLNAQPGAKVEQDVGGIDYSKHFQVEERGAGIKVVSTALRSVDPSHFTGFTFQIVNITRNRVTNP